MTVNLEIGRRGFIGALAAACSAPKVAIDQLTKLNGPSKGIGISTAASARESYFEESPVNISTIIAEQTRRNFRAQFESYHIYEKASSEVNYESYENKYKHVVENLYKIYPSFNTHAIETMAYKERARLEDQRNRDIFQICLRIFTEAVQKVPITQYSDPDLQRYVIATFSEYYRNPFFKEYRDNYPALAPLIKVYETYELESLKGFLI